MQTRTKIVLNQPKKCFIQIRFELSPNIKAFFGFQLNTKIFVHRTLCLTYISKQYLAYNFKSSNHNENVNKV